MYPWKRRAGWWLRNPRFLLFQAREAGGFVSALFGLLLLYMLVRYHEGVASYDAFLAMLSTPVALTVLAVSFAFVMVHTLTWFLLIGKAQPIRFTEKPLRAGTVFAINVVLWVLVSGAVLVIVFGGL